jgi:hypothetical protein
MHRAGKYITVGHIPVSIPKEYVCVLRGYGQIDGQIDRTNG